jgi:NAD(P)-dependent dehydrogenase (short-subunit alcohol dehydrogenase family)
MGGLMGDRLKGKVAIVTGAGSVSGAPDRPAIGNGKAAAIVYATEGASVMAVDLNIDAAEETRRAIAEQGGVCSVLRVDVTRADDCRAMADHCMKTYGRIDILHNNVGMGSAIQGGILETAEEEWDKVMNVNVKSMFHTCKAVVPHMLNGRGGSILNISSLAAVDHSSQPLFIYTISKAAVNSFTRCLAMQLAGKGIRVNAIMPGAIDTPMVYYYERLAPRYGGDLDKMRKVRKESVPMKRMGEPWDVAYAALFLVSDEAKYITGQILGVDGGSMLGTAVT